jgi:hypothetical protein
VANPYLVHPAGQLPLALFAFLKVGLGLWLLSKSLIDDSALLPRLAYFGAGMSVVFLFGAGMA